MVKYKLRTTTVGIDQDAPKPEVISIPAGTVLIVPVGFVNAAGLVEVKWNGKSIEIFGVDLRDRGELIKAQCA